MQRMGDKGIIALLHSGPGLTHHPPVFLPVLTTVLGLLSTAINIIHWAGCSATFSETIHQLVLPQLYPLQLFKQVTQENIFLIFKAEKFCIPNTLK